MKKMLLLVVATISLAFSVIGQTPVTATAPTSGGGGGGGSSVTTPSPVRSPDAPPFIDLTPFKSKPLLTAWLLSRVKIVQIRVSSDSSPTWDDWITIPVTEKVMSTKALEDLVAVQSFPLEFTDVRDPVTTVVRYLASDDDEVTSKGDDKLLFMGQKYDGHLRISSDGTVYLPLEEAQPTVGPAYRVGIRVPKSVTEGFMIVRDAENRIVSRDSIWVNDGVAYLPSEAAGNPGEIVWSYLDSKGATQKFVNKISEPGLGTLYKVKVGLNSSFDGVRTSENDPNSLFFNPVSVNGLGEDYLLESTFTKTTSIYILGTTSEKEMAKGFWVFNLQNNTVTYEPANGKAAFIKFEPGTYRIVADWPSFFDPSFEETRTGVVSVGKGG